MTADPAPDEATAPFGRPPPGWRRRVYAVIFESDTPSGRNFDLLLVALIVLSCAVVMLDSIPPLHARFSGGFEVLEWLFTVLFTIEYFARLACVQSPWRYARSGFGIIDLLAVLPTWAALFLPGLHALIDVRVLRLLRIFRILKLGHYVAEYRALGRALMASRHKIAVFLSFVLLVVVVMGTLMYVVEGPANGFTNVPVSVYWAISTMTTVGFGDITPKTGLGRFIASVMMLTGWGTLAVPTGIVSAEFTAQRFRRGPLARRCEQCGSAGHDADARFCCDCGARLPAHG
jgi:voltage-gated potassium channel